MCDHHGLVVSVCPNVRVSANLIKFLECSTHESPTARIRRGCLPVLPDPASTGFASTSVAIVARRVSRMADQRPWSHLIMPDASEDYLPEHCEMMKMMMQVVTRAATW